MVLGSLQAHAVKVLVRGGYSPCVGTTDFGLPKVIRTYEINKKRDILQPTQRCACEDTDCGASQLGVLHTEDWLIDDNGDRDL
jgi:hypothetical protein